jgi:hypothetical protein
MSSTEQIDIIALLDESGSMSSMAQEPEEAINNFIQDQKKANEDGTFSLWTFNNKVTKIMDDESLKDIKPYKNFRPGGMTALYDAIGNAITLKLTKKNKNNVVCLIVTDGHENSSREFNSAQIKKMICDMETNYKWQFIFIGANQDAVISGGNIGVHPARCGAYEQSPGELLNVTRVISDAVSALRSDSTPLNIPLRSSTCPSSCPSSCPSNEPSNRRPSYLSPRNESSVPPVPPPISRQKALFRSSDSITQLLQ